VWEAQVEDGDAVDEAAHGTSRGGSLTDTAMAASTTPPPSSSLTVKAMMHIEDSTFLAPVLPRRREDNVLLPRVGPPAMRSRAWIAVSNKREDWRRLTSIEKKVIFTCPHWRWN
jgi:hypothetical protein